MEEEKYENTMLGRPKQLEYGGKGKYCCIPECKSAQYDKEGEKTNIGMFKFPDKVKKPETLAEYNQKLS